MLTNGTEEEDEEEYEYGRSLLENTLVTLHSIHQKVLMPLLAEFVMRDHSSSESKEKCVFGV